MHFPAHWARAEHRFGGPAGGRLEVWRWSDASQAEAAASARARLAELLSAIARGEHPPRGDYTDRPMREERLESHPAVGRDPWAIVSRNAAGAAVLNAAHVPFVDVDFARGPGPGQLGRLLRRLVGAAVQLPEAQALAGVKAWAAAQPSVRVRVYRTRAGLRLLFLDRLLDPRGPEARALLKALGADPLYARLCHVQGCFRARLTPKPHRLGLKRPPHQWPAAGPAQEADRARWLEDYAARSRGRAACHLVEELGTAPVLPEAARVRDLHDRAALAGSATPLA